jgi:hypothetical protein
MIPLTGSGSRVAFFAAGNLAFYAGIAMANVLVATFRQTYPPRDMPQDRRRHLVPARWAQAMAGIRKRDLGHARREMVLGNAFLFVRPLWRHRDCHRNRPSSRYVPSEPRTPELR